VGQYEKELELVLHFVNLERDPMKASLIKTYAMANTAETKLFLKRFEDLVSITSPFYN
jgi:hypothetical protein